ncbi:hypothetical protein SAMN04487843_13824 [Methylobacterium sp. ap11]|uniref:hypothetical protein n=1 Tax=Methylobacterium sp. ap11 TaxID=1761799 RepID=UPI0008D37D37|nr:hypothetical protein [Methylobacterium sp. ap11]SEP50624.1 hypothetical protein SAMN04487843_13824 [Methylobacterium sp. ap11]
MKFCVYTSCSINYLPKARALSQSLKLHHPDAVIVLCLNDVIPGWLDLKLEPFDFVWLPHDLGFSNDWIFMHNVMEACTGVKGRALIKIMNEIKADMYLYFDPDVYIYSPLDQIADLMGGNEIGLIPHITKPEETEMGVQLSEISVVAHGIYNLGHLIIKNGESSRKFAKWWDDRLSKFCYDDKEYGLFTDQRWCDLVPAAFDKVAIIRSPNLDVASWNIFGREVLQIKDDKGISYKIDGHNLITYHFSGTGPTGTHRRVREIFAPSNPAVAEIEIRYEETISQHMQNKLENFRYGWDYFDNGEKVHPKTRTLYRKHIDLQKAFPDPYISEGENTYYAWLQKNRPAIIKGLRISPNQIEAAFEELFDEKYYIEENPEIISEIEVGRFSSARDHYIKIGSRLHLDPNPMFVSSFYYENAYKIAGQSIRNHYAPTKENTLLWHYLTVGLENGIEPIEHFDSNLYLKNNPDVELAIIAERISCPLAHFLNHGDTEYRNIMDGSYIASILANNPHMNDWMKKHNKGMFAAYAALGYVAGRIPK